LREGACPTNYGPSPLFQTVLHDPTSRSLYNERMPCWTGETKLEPLGAMRHTDVVAPAGASLGNRPDFLHLISCTVYLWFSSREIHLYICTGVNLEYLDLEES